MATAVNAFPLPYARERGCNEQSGCRMAGGLLKPMFSFEVNLICDECEQELVVSEPLATAIESMADAIKIARSEDWDVEQANGDIRARCSVCKKDKTV